MAWSRGHTDEFVASPKSMAASIRWTASARCSATSPGRVGPSFDARSFRTIANFRRRSTDGAWAFRAPFATRGAPGPAPRSRSRRPSITRCDGPDPAASPSRRCTSGAVTTPRYASERSRATFITPSHARAIGLTRAVRHVTGRRGTPVNAAAVIAGAPSMPSGWRKPTPRGPWSWWMQSTSRRTSTHCVGLLPLARRCGSQCSSHSSFNQFAARMPSFRTSSARIRTPATP